jgi:hypothetical protein
MEITYTPDREDYINAQKAHSWRRYSPAMQTVQQILEPILGIGLLWYAFHLANTGSNGAFVLIEAVLGLYVLLRGPFLQPLLLKRAYRRRHPDTPQPVLWKIEQDNIQCASFGRGDANINWGMIRGYLDRPTMLLLYTAPATFLYFPSRFLSEAQRAGIIELLKEHNVPATFPR